MVDEIARRRGVRLAPTECNAAVGRLPGDSLVLAEPHTFMNRSGYAARCLLERYGFELEDVLVVYDEVALPLGRLRLRPAGSPAGHRGLESVIAELRSDRIPRLRLGIGGEEPPEDLVEYVLAAFDGRRAGRRRGDGAACRGRLRGVARRGHGGGDEPLQRLTMARRRLDDGWIRGAAAEQDAEPVSL